MTVKFAIIIVTENEVHDERQKNSGIVFGIALLSASFRMWEKDGETGSDAKSESQCVNHL